MFQVGANEIKETNSEYKETESPNKLHRRLGQAIAASSTSASKNAVPLNLVKKNRTQNEGSAILESDTFNSAVMNNVPSNVQGTGDTPSDSKHSIPNHSDTWTKTIPLPQDMKRRETELPRQKQVQSSKCSSVTLTFIVFD